MKRYNFTNPLFLLKIEAMIRRFYILFCLFFLVACDDGDILTVQLDFDQELERCDNFEDSYVVFDTRQDPDEALILIFPKNDITEAYFSNDTPAIDLLGLPVTDSINLLDLGVSFNYRTYNRSVTNSDICSVLPPDDLSIREDYPANSGTVSITFTYIDDDNDGIPSEFEYGPGGLANPQDSDSDGIPDYLDQDDDNDNVLTINELNDDDDDDDPSTNPLDTDGDGDYDYLDDDDDNDGIPTRLEDASVSQDPRDLDNRVFDLDGIEVYRYLYDGDNATEAFEDSGFIYNDYTRSATTRFEILNAGLEIINSTYIDLGNYENSFIITNEPEED